MKWTKLLRAVIGAWFSVSLLFADCVAERDCSGCNPPGFLEVRCKCPAGSQKCTQCTCTDPQCEGSWENGSCCCENASGAHCVYIQCDKSKAPVTQEMPDSSSGASPEVIVANKPGVTLTDVKAHVTGNNLNGLEYVMRNSSNKDLLAIEVWWTVFSGERVAQFAFCQDHWLTGYSVLPAASFENQELPVSVSAKDSIAKIAGSVVYAQFTDGTAVGEEYFTTCIQRQRREVNQLSNDLRRIFQEQGVDSFQAALSSTSTGDTFAQRVARRRIQEIYRTSGLGPALDAVDRFAGGFRPQ
jgi:hypothetical protein